MTTTREPDFNPYAAPRTDGLGPTDYYRMVGRRVSYAEYWRMASNPLVFLILAVFKTLGLSYPFKSAICYPRRLTLVDRDKIPDHIRSIWAEPLAEAERLGFRLLFCYTIPTLGVSKQSMAAVLLSSDARTSATLSYLRIQAGPRLNEVVVIAASSRLPDGRRASTRNSRAMLNPPPDTVVHDVPKRRTFGEVVEAHREWLMAHAWEPQPIPEAGLAELLHQRERAAIDFQIARGVFRQMTEREVEAFSRITPRANAVALTDADRRFFRVLRFFEQFTFVVMLAGLAYSWTEPRMGHALVNELVVFGGLACLCVLAAVRRAKTKALQRRS